MQENHFEKKCYQKPREEMKEREKQYYYE